MMSHFGDVRSVLQLPPTAKRWIALLDALSKIEPQGARHEAMHYAKDHLNAWPDRLRFVSNSYRWDWELLTLASAIFWGEGADESSIEDIFARLDHPLRVLSVSEPLEASRAIRCLEHPSVATTLKVLHLNNIHIEQPQEHEQLAARLSQMPELVELALDNQTIEVKVLARLLDSFAPGQLRRLSLQSCGLSAAHLELLAHHPSLYELRWLAIGQNNLRATDIAKLNQGPGLSRLSWLSLWHNPIGDEGVEALGQDGRFEQLRHINLGGTQLGSQVLDRILETAFGSWLETLWIWDASTPRLASMRKLLSSRQGGRLKRLNLNNIPINTRLAQVIGESYGASGLAHLQLYNCQLGKAQLDALLSPGKLHTLRELDLRNNPKLTPDFIPLLKHLPGLNYLNLAEEAVPWEQLRALLQSELVPKLQCFELSTGQFNQVQLIALLKQCPHRPADLLFDRKDEEIKEQSFDDFALLSAMLEADMPVSV